MKRHVIAGATIGLLAGIPWLALSYAGFQAASLPVVPFSLFEWLTRILPGGLVTAGLEVMIQTLHSLQLGPLSVLGKSVQIGMAYTLALFGLTLLGALYGFTLGRLNLVWLIKGLAAGLAVWFLALLLAVWGGWGMRGALPGASWLLFLSLAWGLVLAWGVARLTQTMVSPTDAGRRQALAYISLGSLAVGGLAIGLGRWLAARQDQQLATAAPETIIPPEPSPEAITTAGVTPTPGEPGFEPLAGTRPEITPIRDFYRVDINLLPPGQEDFAAETDTFAQRLRAQGGDTEVPVETYQLVVDGLVEKPLALDLAALQALPRYQQYATLMCISNPVGGDLIGTTLFQGARLKDVLDLAGIKPEAIEVKFTCIDGYTESLPLESANDPRTLLCYGMGNQPLTREHGAPIRLYTPDRYGMKNPKWIIKIEAIVEEYFGYWEVRGWSKDAWVKTTSIIDVTDASASNQAEAGGIAFAGARGVKGMQLRAADGEWVDAVVKNPLSPLSWVLWRANLKISPGKHNLSVRAIDGEGEVQTERTSPTYPDGASGHHSRPVEVG